MSTDQTRPVTTAPLTPLGDRLLIRRTRNPDLITPGGLIIPETAREKPQEGEVVAVGTRVYDIRVGDRALFGRYAGETSKVNLGDDELLVMREGDVLGVIEMEAQ